MPISAHEVLTRCSATVFETMLCKHRKDGIFESLQHCARHACWREQGLPRLCTASGAQLVATSLCWHSHTLPKQRTNTTQRTQLAQRLVAYGGHNVALEIQATIPIKAGQPTTVPPMMKGVNWTFVITGIAYFAVSIVGFWAFGTSVADNVLLSFTRGPNSWVVAMADKMVVVHVASAYQVYMQPVYQIVEKGIMYRTGKERVNPWLGTGFRLGIVALITIIGILIPFFSNLMGLIGALTVTPTTFLFPPLFWLLFKRPTKWSYEWSVNWFLVIITGIIGVLGTVGAIYGIVNNWYTYKIFAA